MKRVKLGDSSIAEIFSGQPAPQNIKFASSEGFPFIRAKSLEFLCSGGSEEQLEHIDAKTAKKYKLRLFPANTVIFAKSGMSAKIPRVYRLKGHCYLVSHLAAIITHKNLSSKYLEYYLKYNHPSSLISNDSYPSIRLIDIKEFEICFPELHEQQKISDILQLIEQTIYNKNCQLYKLDNLVKSRFVEMFGDMFLNSCCWDELPLENLANIVSGITKGRKTHEKDLIEVPYMAVSNVKDGFIDWTTVKTIMATKQEIDKFKLLPYDILMTEGGDPDKLGRGAVLIKPLENSIHQNHIFRIRLQTEKILPFFFSEYLKQQKAKRYFLGCAKQTTGIASINMKQLRALPVLLPPLKLQNQFVTFVQQVDKSKLAVKQSLEKLEILKKSLMQEYFG